MRFLKSNPIFSLLNSYMIDSPQPANISYMWNFGSLLGVCLVIQILTGVFLAMHYTPNVDLAFTSVEHIMRDVNSGWFLRYTHANVASFFFLFLYFHTARGLYYSSYRTPRALVWSIGVIILILTMATAFLGYIYSPKWLYNIIHYFSNVIHSTMDYSSFDFNVLNKICTANLSLPMKDFLSYLTKMRIVPYSYYENIDSHSVQNQIKTDTKETSGIYLILNKKNLEFYIGSASTNRFYLRFSNHLIYFRGSKIVKYAVKKYGLSSFAFFILELFPDKVTKENNRQLLDREDFYLKYLLPNYNILTEAGSSFGYKHTEIDRKKMSENFSLERREQIGALNRGRNLASVDESKETREKLSQSHLLLNKKGKIQYSEQALLNMKKKSKKVIFYNKDKTVFAVYPSIIDASKQIRCGEKTIRRALNSKTHLLKNQFLVYYYINHSPMSNID